MVKIFPVRFERSVPYRQTNRWTEFEKGQMDEQTRRYTKPPKLAKKDEDAHDREKSRSQSLTF